MIYLLFEMEDIAPFFSCPRGFESFGGGFVDLRDSGLVVWGVVEDHFC